MRNVERCDRCNKFTMVGIDNGSALLFAHQWCKCSEERENVMSDNTRDTQFQGFAKLLLDEMDNVDGIYIDTYLEHWREAWQDIIARRAYDLVKHAQADPKDLDVLGFEEAIGRIPDMTELPKE